MSASDQWGQVMMQAGDRRTESRDIGLPLAADIEQPRMDGDRHGQAGENEVCGVKQRVAPAIGRPESAAEHDGHGLDRVFPDEQHHEAGDEKRQDDR